MLKANKLALAICAAVSSQAFALPAADFEGVCFYEHTDMLGQEFCYASGAEIANVGSGANDKFSSFKTFGNAYAEIYEHTNYQGAKTTVMMNAYDMSFLEDGVSSLKIKLRKRKDFACVFEHTNYRGTGSCAEAGSGVPYMPFYNQASSILIAGHAVLNGYAYENYNTNQRYAGFYRAYGNLNEVGWNDDFDSFQVLDWDKNTDAWDNRRRPTLDAQEQISTDSKIFKNTSMGSHNAYNAPEYVSTFWGYNHKETLAEQLDMGSRTLEIDIHDNGTIVYHTPEAGLASAKTTLTRYLMEIDNWLKGADGDDVVFIKVEDLMNDGDQPEEWAAWNITKTLGDLVYRKPDGATDNLYLPSNISIKDIAKAGKRIVFWSNGAGNSNANYKNIVWQRTGSESGRDDNWNGGCGDTSNYWGNAGNMSLVNEDARGSVQFLDSLASFFGQSTSYSGQIPDTQIRSALECGALKVMTDNLTWENSPRWWAFSWAWPSGVNGQNGDCAIYQRDNKSIQGDSCGTTRPFVCRKSDDSLFLSSGTGTWSQGNIVCHNEVAGSTFSTITNAREGKLVRDQQYGTNQVMTWMNARKIGTDWVPHPEKQFFSLVEQRSGKCLDVPGDDNALYDGQRVQVWDCQANASDQKWYYDYSTAMLHNKANPNFCLDNRGQTWDGGGIGIHTCVDHINLKFDMLTTNLIRTRGHGDFVLDASSDWNGANVTSWQYHGGNNQRWKKVYPQ